MKNLLDNFKRSNFMFLNMDADDELSLVETKNDGISLIPAAQSDFTEGEAVNKSAICMYTEANGDFASRIHIDHDFNYEGDAAGLIVITPQGWAKICFEKSSFDTHSITSTVTKNGFSDTAFGEVHPFRNIWLLAARKGGDFAFHYSPNGTDWHLVRHFNISDSDSIKVGLIAQSPNGEGDSTMNFFSFELGACAFEDIKSI